MGKGDKKTRRGKIFMGSFGVKRPRKPSGSPFVPKAVKTSSMVSEQPVVKPAKVEKQKTVEVQVESNSLALETASNVAKTAKKAPAKAKTAAAKKKPAKKAVAKTKTVAKKAATKKK